MPREYEREYSEDAGDYKRKRRNVEDGDGSLGNLNSSSMGEGVDAQDGQGTSSANNHYHHEVPLNEKTNEYLQDCLEEQKSIEKKYPICKRLLDFEIEKVLVSGRIPKQEIYANVYMEKPIRVAQKVLFPIKEYPKFNFVGKILGPKGNTLRQLQEETFCKMIIMGRNSMRDHVKEEELRNSGDAKFAHLSRDLHMEISTVAPPSEAYHRLAYALAEVRKYMIPDANDDIRLEQLREMDGKDKFYKKAPYAKAYGHHGMYASRTPPPTYDKTSKPKVYSILEKARYAMEDPAYGMVKPHRSRDHELYEHTEYDRYASPPPPPPPPKHTGGHHAAYEGSTPYERDYRRDYAHPQSYAAAYAAKSSNGRSSSSYRPATSSHTSSHYESGSRSRESVRYRTAPYPKIR